MDTISKEKLLEIWNEVDRSVKNLINNGLYKDSTLAEAILNKKFKGVRNIPANDNSITWDKSSGITRFYNTTISRQP